MVTMVTIHMYVITCAHRPTYSVVQCFPSPVRLACCSAVVVHFEQSEYVGREVAGEQSEVEYAVVAEGEFEVNFTVVVETEDATARGNQGTLKCFVCVYCVWGWE